VYNASSGIITSPIDGIFIVGGSGTVANFGMIAGTSISGLGVYLVGGSSTITNAGTIIGTSGTAVAFRGGGNRVIVEPGAVFGGIVNAGTSGGNNTLELGPNTGGAISSLAGTFVNFNSIVFDPGSNWQFGTATTIASGMRFTKAGPFANT